MISFDEYVGTLVFDWGWADMVHGCPSIFMGIVGPAPNYNSGHRTQWLTFRGELTTLVIREDQLEKFLKSGNW